MGLVLSKLTVMFESPFWILLIECQKDFEYQVCKITFGAEPSDTQVYEFLLKDFSKLKFSPTVEVEKTIDRKINPKRMQRLINKSTVDNGIGTKAQQALKLQHEQFKTEHKIRSKLKREEQKERQFELKLKKRKEKHKGH